MQNNNSESNNIVKKFKVKTRKEIALKTNPKQSSTFRKADGLIINIKYIAKCVLHIATKHGFKLRGESDLCAVNMLTVSTYTSDIQK